MAAKRVRLAQRRKAAGFTQEGLAAASRRPPFQEMPVPVVAEALSYHWVTTAKVASETVGKDSRGWDEAKKINGRKRHLICDNRGLVLLVMVTAADVTDRDAAEGTAVPPRADASRDRHRLGRLRAMPGTGALGQDLPRSHHQDGAPPTGGEGRRWVVERPWSWIMRGRRHCRDHQRLPEMSESLITWAATTLMTRRRTRRKARSAQRRDVAREHLMPKAA